MKKGDVMKTEICGNIVRLKRNQWKDQVAQINNYHGLLDEVQKYTWTYTRGNHPYLQSRKLKMSLHKFVLSYLYGANELNTMLRNNNIIEHLDNDGLNCCYDNLHVLHSNWNKGKAFTIDNSPETTGIPAYITDVYYSHKNCRYQMQIFLNKNIYRLIESDQPVEKFICLYKGFKSLFIDWLYINESREDGNFDISKFHSDKILISLRPTLYLTEEEKDARIIERDGEFYLRIETEDPKKMAFVNHTTFQEIDSTEGKYQCQD